MLAGRFTSVQQAIGLPKARVRSAEFLQKFVEEAKASGLVATLIARHGIEGLSVSSSFGARLELCGARLARARSQDPLARVTPDGLRRTLRDLRVRASTRADYREPRSTIVTSVCTKSSPLKRSGSPVEIASAYEKQSP